MGHEVEGDEVVGAALIGPDDDLLLVSRKAQSIRFKADDDETLPPMGLGTSGVIGMHSTQADELLAVEVVREAGSSDDQLRTRHRQPPVRRYGARARCPRPCPGLLA